MLTDTTIYLGLTFAGPLLPTPPTTALGQHYLNYAGLRAYLERFYALGRSPANRDALRIEQYRQLVEAHLESAANLPFYSASFTIDRLATAEELLSRRDELLEAGYSLAPAPGADTPERICVLHELEALVLEDNGLDLMPGAPEQLTALLAALHNRRHPPLTIWLHEPEDLLPPGLNRLLNRLRTLGDTVNQVPEPTATSGETDLQRWQRKLRLLLTGESEKQSIEARGDGSLVILRAERETHLAAYLARMVSDNANWRPDVLLTNRNQTLDTALRMEELPSMGIPSTSLARPSLQVLKLVTAFLWEPIEVQRIMEFVSLVTKPLERRLGQKLAVHLADTPGLYGARWTFAVEEAFRKMQERNYPPARIRRAREQYEFWFRRRRYPRDGRVPKGEVRSLFVFLRNWALEAFDEDPAQTGLIVLSAQSERATELLDAQPEADLSYLEVERLVRTIYQPAPTQFNLPEQGALRTSFAPASTARLPNSGQGPLERLVWWDFVEADPQYFFSRYYPPELAYLRERGCEPTSPAQKNRLQTWQNLRPLLHTRRQLILCLPRRVDGAEVEPHTLMGDLEAAFTEASLHNITVDIDAAGQAAGPLGDLQLPRFTDVPVRTLDLPVPHLTITRPEALQARERETPTAIEDLLYYPHKWVFRHQLKLRGTPILAIASENRLRGNLSHLFVEQLLSEIKDAGTAYERTQVETWIDQNANRLLSQQGAVLLEYGQEPERVQFLLTLKKSAWTLVSYIQKNRWTISGSELEVEGEITEMGGQRVGGRADLVLERPATDGQVERCVVDLKWRGASIFRNYLKNAWDVQLCLYAEFLRQKLGGTVHTAYYLLRDAKMLSRNELAFAGAEVVPVADDFKVVQRETLAKIRNTQDWRWEQFADGRVEVRCEDTLGDLDDLYLNLDHATLLEMKSAASPFDDYRSLIGMVR